MTKQNSKFYVYGSVHHNTFYEINNQQMQLYAVNFIPLLRSLYMFRVFYTPIMSTIFNCIYSHWYKPQYRLSYLLPVWLGTVSSSGIKLTASVGYFIEQNRKFTSCKCRSAIPRSLPTFKLLENSHFCVLFVCFQKLLSSKILHPITPQAPA